MLNLEIVQTLAVSRMNSIIKQVKKLRAVVKLSAT